MERVCPTSTVRSKLRYTRPISERRCWSRAENGKPYVDGPYLWQINGACAVYAHIGIEINLAPDANAEHISRADDVVRGNGYLFKRSKGGRHIAKQVRAKGGQHLACSPGNKFLKLGKRLGRSRHCGRHQTGPLLGCCCGSCGADAEIGIRAHRQRRTRRDIALSGLKIAP